MSNQDKNVPYNIKQTSDEEKDSQDLIVNSPS